MKCLRIYATPDFESHFDEVELPTTKRSMHPGRQSCALEQAPCAIVQAKARTGCYRAT